MKEKGRLHIEREMSGLEVVYHDIRVWIGLVGPTESVQDTNLRVSLPPLHSCTRHVNARSAWGVALAAKQCVRIDSFAKSCAIRCQRICHQ